MKYHLTRDTKGYNMLKNITFFSYIQVMVCALTLSLIMSTITNHGKSMNDIKFHDINQMIY